MSAHALPPLQKPTATTAYTLRQAAQTYVGRTVLTIGQLAIRSGEILAVVGPSGAGKSTLLRLLAFLERAALGEMTFQGRACGPDWPDQPARRRVTMVVHPPQLLRRSVHDNVAYGLRVRGTRQPAQEVAAAIRQVGLTDLAGALAPTLSSGERQRVVLARALVLRSDVLLLDEPTANLDPGNVGLIEEIIRRRNGDSGTTVVMATHNVFQARRLAQRVVLLLNGCIVEIAPTEEFFQRPRHPQTAAFVRGDMTY